jgi:hypothetical protein
MLPFTAAQDADKNRNAAFSFPTFSRCRDCAQGMPTRVTRCP